MNTLNLVLLLTDFSNAINTHFSFAIERIFSFAFTNRHLRSVLTKRCTPDVKCITSMFITRSNRKITSASQTQEEYIIKVKETNYYSKRFFFSLADLYINCCSIHLNKSAKGRIQFHLNTYRKKKNKYI